MRDPHQAEEAVGVEDEVGLGGGAVADEGVHAADLEVGGHELQVVVDAAQLRLLQLHADVLRDQVDRHLILLPAAASTCGVTVIAAHLMGARPGC